MAGSGILKSYAGAAVPTKLAATISATATSFELANSQGWPDGADGPFVATLSRGLSSEEKVLCSSRAGNIVQIQQRGWDETTPSMHGGGDSAVHTIDADSLSTLTALASRRSYTHVQDVPAAEWTVVHGLGYFPNVTVFDSTGRIVLTDVVHTNTDSLLIQASAAFGGKAYLS